MPFSFVKFNYLRLCKMSALNKMWRDTLHQCKLFSFCQHVLTIRYILSCNICVHHLALILVTLSSCTENFELVVETALPSIVNISCVCVWECVHSPCFYISSCTQCKWNKFAILMNRLLNRLKSIRNFNEQHFYVWFQMSVSDMVLLHWKATESQ